MAPFSVNMIRLGPNEIRFIFSQIVSLYGVSCHNGSLSLSKM